MPKKLIAYLLSVVLFLVALILFLSYIILNSGEKESSSKKFMGPPFGAVPYVKGPESLPPNFK